MQQLDGALQAPPEVPDHSHVQDQQPGQQLPQPQLAAYGGGAAAAAAAAAAAPPAPAPPPQLLSAGSPIASVNAAPPPLTERQQMLMAQFSFAPPVPPRIYTQAVIGAKRPEDVHKKTLVLDLDETLVHSSFKPIRNPDYIIPVEIDGRLVDVYVLKRPWLDHFMSTVGPRFEVVVFTASLAKYADPLLDLMDKEGCVRWRLFREACCPFEGNYVKDLLCLGRPLSSTIIVDNSPHSYIFQPDNALPIGTFIDNMEDQELLEILPQLLKVEGVDDVRALLGPQNVANYQLPMQMQMPPPPPQQCPGAGAGAACYAAPGAGEAGLGAAAPAPPAALVPLGVPC